MSTVLEPSLVRCRPPQHVLHGSDVIDRLFGIDGPDHLRDGRCSDSGVDLPPHHQGGAAVGELVIAEIHLAIVCALQPAMTDVADNPDNLAPGRRLAR